MNSHTTDTIDYLHVHIPRPAFYRLYWIEHWHGRTHGLFGLFCSAQFCEGALCYRRQASKRVCGDRVTA
jgi:hypothetical protein